MGAASNIRGPLAGQARAAQINRSGLGVPTGPQGAARIPQEAARSPQREVRAEQGSAPIRGNAPEQRQGVDLGPGRGRRFTGLGGF